VFRTPEKPAPEHGFEADSPGERRGALGQVFKAALINLTLISAALCICSFHYANTALKRHWLRQRKLANSRLNKPALP
jgi:hypothetical protein